MIIFYFPLPSSLSLSLLPVLYANMLFKAFSDTKLKVGALASRYLDLGLGLLYSRTVFTIQWYMGSSEKEFNTAVANVV